MFFTDKLKKESDKSAWLVPLAILDRIGNKIGDDLLQLSRVSPDGLEAVLVRYFQSQIIGDRHRGKRFLDLRAQRGQANRLELGSDISCQQNRIIGQFPK